MEQKNKSGAEAIRTLAKRYGFYHPNKFYIQKAREEYGINVTQVSIVQSIGALKTRRNTLTLAINLKAKELLVSCDFDVPLAIAVLKNAF